MRENDDFKNAIFESGIYEDFYHDVCEILNDDATPDRANEIYDLFDNAVMLIADIFKKNRIILPITLGETVYVKTGNHYLPVCIRTANKEADGTYTFNRRDYAENEFTVTGAIFNVNCFKQKRNEK